VIPMGPTSSGEPPLSTALAVLEVAVAARWRAPESTVALADHAAALARTQRDVATALRAEGWWIHGLAAMGRGASGVPRAVAALEEASCLGDDDASARLRIGLASVARELGDPSSALALLVPVIERESVDLELVADAHLEAVWCQAGNTDEELAIAADAAGRALRRLSGEHPEFGLAALNVALASRHRGQGRYGDAAEQARAGLRRLLGDQLGGVALDPVSPHLAAWLTLELTLALLDDDQPAAARRAAEPALGWAGRGAALLPLTKLRLALAYRVYLSVGDHEAALSAARWASDVVGQHDLLELEADCHSLLAELSERQGSQPEALAASRRAHHASRLHSARAEQALVLLARCAGGLTEQPSGYLSPLDIPQPSGVDVLSAQVETETEPIVSARWVEYAEDTPEAQFGIAVGTVDPVRSAEENMAESRVQLTDVTPQPANSVVSPPSRGRHFLDTQPTPVVLAASNRRVTAQPGSGGRRRRPDTDGEPITNRALEPAVNGHCGAEPAEPAESNETSEFLNGSDPAAHDGPAQRGVDPRPLAELSFAELLAGALAAYRES